MDRYPSLSRRYKGGGTNARQDDTTRTEGHMTLAEIWLYHQTENRLHVLTCADGEVATRRTFGEDTPIESKVLPRFHSTMRAVTGR